MALPSSISTRKKKPGQPKTALGRFLKGTFGQLFCKRSLIIISGHKTQHVPFAAGTQAVLAVVVLGAVAWGAFSSGSYVAAQKVIDEKEQKLASFAEENQRVEAEFSMLKQDLMKLAEGGKGAAAAQAAKQIADQYEAKDAAEAAVAAAKLSSTNDEYSKVFERIQFLENKVKALQSDHNAMMADIRATTGGKIKELERLIARTGVNSGELRRAAEAKRNQEEQRREKYGRIEDSAAGASAVGAVAQGGPYAPSAGAVLKEKETELYFSLRKLRSLNDVVSAMPLAMPISNARKTSGFGTRVDPFRGTLSHHAGIDLAGPSGSKVFAANNGRVDFAGWKTAYGNVVDVKHEYGFTTRYGHLRKILVRPGQVVKKGQVIAIQGSTGRSTGDHLHYEVRYNDKPINPANFLGAGGNV
jgi:murein DD-endopeptidase MepM/ murein hydrolase activator NlpD